MGAINAMQRRQRDGTGAYLVGQRREAELDAFAGIALALAVQRLMLAELLEQDHGQQARAGPAARGGMERRRRLGDLLAVAAGELLADVWITFHWRGITSSVSVTSSPSLASRWPSRSSRTVGARSPRARAADAPETACGPGAGARRRGPSPSGPRPARQRVRPRWRSPRAPRSCSSICSSSRALRSDLWPYSSRRSFRIVRS